MKSGWLPCAPCLQGSLAPERRAAAGVFHNGRFKSLKDALAFHVQRDTAPEKWYPRNPDGSVNVNTTEAPYDRKPGDALALSDEEIEDVIALHWIRRLERLRLVSLPSYSGAR